MCWISRNYIEKIAKENLLVYKIVNIEKRKSLLFFKRNIIKSLHFGYIYKLNKVYKQNMCLGKDHSSKQYLIERGIHSYEFIAGNGLNKSLDVYSDEYYMLCIIPKGSKYVVSDLYLDEVVSNSIKPLAIYKNRKDILTSKYFKKYNKIL